MDLQQYVLIGAGGLVFAGWFVACIASLVWLAIGRRIQRRAAIRRRLAKILGE